ncbi:MAG: porin [Gammaproteobacteria bacterium]|nr:porin [Gammaproteobacteria bacterium]MCW9032234.1 porin [Gammaproteobacteria bacterium]
MNKKLIAIAVASVMAAPVAMADVKISGRVGLDFTTLDTDGVANDVRDVTDNAATRIQFDGTVGNAYARIARDMRGGGEAARDQYYGYKLDNGMTVQLGRMATAGKNAEKDPYITSFLETRGTVANSATANKYSSNSFVDNLVQLSMKAGDAKIKIQYDPTEYSGIGAANANSGHIAVGVSGKAGGVNYHVSYNNGAADQDNTAASYNSQSNIKVGANMKFGMAKVALMYTSMDKGGATAANNATDSILVTADMDLGNGLSANVGLATRSGDVAADDAEFMRLAVMKKLNEGTSVYAGYTSTDYDAASANADTSELGVGMIVKF